MLRKESPIYFEHSKPGKIRPTILVSLDWRRPQDPRTGLGIASIAAALEASKVPIKVIYDHVNRSDFTLEPVIKRLQSEIRNAGPKCLIGIGAYVWNEAYTQQLLQWLTRQCCDVVIGGPQVSYCGTGVPENLYQGVYAFVRGQGEPGMIDLATGRETTGKNGVHIVGDKDLGATANLSLAGLSSPYLTGTIEPQTFVRWETQRGCQFKCSFCQHRDPDVRSRPKLIEQDRLVSELALFHRSGVERVAVLDPIFHSNPQHAISILEQAKSIEFAGTLSIQCRLETITPEFLQACSGLDVEMEFGLQTAIMAESRVVQRNNNMKAVERGIELLHSYGMKFQISLIYGLPTQTLDSFIESVEWCLSHRVPTIDAWPLMLLRGTPLYDQRQKYGLIESDGGNIPIVVESSSFSREDHREMARIAAGLGEITYPREAA